MKYTELVDSGETEGVSFSAFIRNCIINELAQTRYQSCQHAKSITPRKYKQYLSYLDDNSSDET